MYNLLSLKYIYSSALVTEFSFPYPDVRLPRHPEFDLVSSTFWTWTFHQAAIYFIFFIYNFILHYSGMPKTRRAGRKDQVRRLLRNLIRPPTSSFPPLDPVSIPIPSRTVETRIQWPENLPLTEVSSTRRPPIIEAADSRSVYPVEWPEQLISEAAAFQLLIKRSKKRD